MRRVIALLLCGLTVVAGVAAAQDSVVIYRCTDASGTVSVQNDIPCPKGSEQQRRVIETVRPPSQPYVPPPRAAKRVPVVTASASATPEKPEKPAADDAESDHAAIGLLPPPPLFACRTWNREDYLSDDPTPAKRCALLRTVGVDGDPTRGAGTACETVRDTCTPVPEPQRCERWQQHSRDTEAMLLFGRAEDPAATRLELERIAAIIRSSDCAP